MTFPRSCVMKEKTLKTFGWLARQVEMLVLVVAVESAVPLVVQCGGNSASSRPTWSNHWSWWSVLGERGLLVAQFRGESGPLWWSHWSWSWVWWKLFSCWCTVAETVVRAVQYGGDPGPGGPGGPGCQWWTVCCPSGHHCLKQAVSKLVSLGEMLLDQQTKEGKKVVVSNRLVEDTTLMLSFHWF